MNALELARKHEAELKQSYKQYGLLGALIRQIMVGRSITTGRYWEPVKVTDIKLQDGKVQIYGKPRGKRRPALISDSLANVILVEGAKP